MNSFRSLNDSLKYWKLTASGCKDIGNTRSEFVGKTQFLYTKIHIYAEELPPMRVQYPGHVSLSVSRDQCTALPQVGVLMTSYVLVNNIIN